MATIARFVGALLDLLLPPRCLACGVEISAAHGLCPACWSELRLLAPPWCRCCGFPLPHAFADAPLCGGCADAPPGFDRARAALRYDARSSRIILGFKRGGRLDGVPVFARWMAQAGEELLADADLILPVPLHRWRLLTRGFNQSAVLAQRIARLTGRPWAPGLLERHRATVSQQGLGAQARAAEHHRRRVSRAAARARRRRQGAAGRRRADHRRHAGGLRRRCCVAPAQHGWTHWPWPG